MSIWGKQIDAAFTPKAREEGAPESVIKRAGIVALGILIAAAVLFAAYRSTLPSDTECAIQRTDVALGERVAVESACVGRV